MKIAHLADLHLGKRVNDFSMIEDQRYILDQILDIIRGEKPDAVVIAGDVYDKPMPSAEAVTLFDGFISSLESLGIATFVVSGNHDSAERLSFGSSIMDKRGVHFAGGYDGSTRRISLNDEYGKVDFYLLPFVKPAHVRAAFYDDEDAQKISSFTEAVEFAVEKMGVERSERNVLVAHQFCTGACRCESEEISIGGLDNVDPAVFSVFDYTALGHLHGPQDVGGESIRYSGSPLKYSFSEADHIKSLTVIELGPKDKACEIIRRTIGLKPLRDMKVLRGSFDELTDKKYYEHIDTDGYMRIILTDEEDVIGALAALRSIYPNIMRLEYDNTRSRAAAIMPEASDSDSRTPLEIFGDLYESQNGKPLDAEQTALLNDLIGKVWSE